MGKVVRFFMPQAVIGDTSARGYAEDSYVSLMRALVVLLEFLIFVPGYLRLVKSYSNNENLQKYKYALLLGVMTVPPMVFVDHGHF